MQLSITKRDGTKEIFNADRINRSIERACEGFPDPISMVTQIASETQLTLYDGMTTQEMDEATINASVQNIKDDVNYDVVATRLLLKTVYRRVIGEYNIDDPHDLRARHRETFIAFVKKQVAEGILDERLTTLFDLEVLANTLDITRDGLFQYAGLSGLLDRYALKDSEQRPAETPQYFFMRIAMGLSYNEKNPTEWAKRFYEKFSRHEYIPGGSTNVNGGTAHPALSNCFLLEMHDDMDHIAKSVSDVMKISKATGGLGVSVTKLRAAGSPLRSSNTVSSGPTTFAKIMDVAIRAIQRGGKKKGALCFYMENWHLDFPEFIEWKHNAGDDHVRMRTANTAAYISDEFMKRVKQGSMWYLFDPKEVPDLVELYGSAFSKRYAEYVEQAEKGALRLFKKMPARELYRQMLVSLQTTSHPWQTWKDPINVRALNNNTGTIHMSNLCTEICLPQDRENIAVCNLASINLSKHIREKEILWGKLEESVRFAVRHLDNLIDINELPIPEAAKSDKENRAIGLGVMGFAETIERLGFSYDSEPAYDFADRVFEFISYMAIDESANLAEERGAYHNFNGSRWSQGMVPIDTMHALEEDRGIPLRVPKDSKHRGLDWDVLRAKVKRGMRNATLMAVAPNANIGLLVGTTPGIDARFAQVFSRNKFSGKYLDINHNMVKDLRNMGIWDTVKDKIIEHHGDLSLIEEIPAHIKDIYKTSFNLEPEAFLHVAARAQKWVDQALSRNMYIKTRDIDEMMEIYMTGWELGVKTTYYCHMQPRHTAEQSTTRVNKAQSLLGGRKGFAGLQKEATLPIVEEKVKEAVVAPVPAFVSHTQEVYVAETPTPKQLFKEVDYADKAVERIVGGEMKHVATAIPAQSIEQEKSMYTEEGVLFAGGAVGFGKGAFGKGFGAVADTPASGGNTFSSQEKVTVHATGRGFSAVAERKDAPLPKRDMNDPVHTCPVDPALLAQCDSCQ